MLGLFGSLGGVLGGVGFVPELPPDPNPEPLPKPEPELPPKPLPELPPNAEPELLPKLDPKLLFGLVPFCGRIPAPVAPPKPPKSACGL